MNESRQIEAQAMSAGPPTVTTLGTGTGFAQEIIAGSHRLTADEPFSAGGSDTGPNPYELLLASLGACTSMTVALYARRKNWPLAGVTVKLSLAKVHAEDCAECETRDGMIDRIERDIKFDGPLNDDQKSRLIEIAGKCPIHRTLTSKIDIRTHLVR
jgi:putative redox protein